MSPIKRFIESVIPLFWCSFSFWQLLFGMNISGFICLMALPWFLGPLNPKEMHWSSYLFVYIGSFFMLWNIGLGEYSRQFRYYSCRSKQAYGIPRNRYPSWCNEFDLLKPHRRSTKQIFSYRERVAIHLHHINVLWSAIMPVNVPRYRVGAKFQCDRHPLIMAVSVRHLAI